MVAVNEGYVTYVAGKLASRAVKSLEYCEIVSEHVLKRIRFLLSHFLLLDQGFG